MIDVRRLRSFVAEDLEAIRPEVGAEIFAAWNEQLIVRLNHTSEIPCNGIQEPKSSTAYGVDVLATFHDGDALQVDFGSESDDMSVAGPQRALKKDRRNAVHDPDFKSLPSPLRPSIYAPNLVIEGPEDLSHDALRAGVGTGLYIGRIWYTYPINGLGPEDFTSTIAVDSYLIKDGKLVQPLKRTIVHIKDNIIHLFQQIIGVSRGRKPTLVWSAEETVVAPELAVRQVHVDNIAEYMG